MAAELAAKGAKRKPLSTQQLRDTLDNLERRDLFRRCQASRRTVYFSTTLDRPELLAAVKATVKERLEKKKKVQLLRELDRANFTQPNENQTGANQEPLKKVGTTSGTADGTTIGTTKRNAPETNAT